MENAKGNRFASEVKLRAVIELLKGNKTAVEIAQGIGCHPTLLKGWKDRFLAMAPKIFETKKTEDDTTKKIDRLEQIVGKQTVQIEFLKKVHESLSSR